MGYRNNIKINRILDECTNILTVELRQTETQVHAGVNVGSETEMYQKFKAIGESLTEGSEPFSLSLSTP